MMVQHADRVCPILVVNGPTAFRTLARVSGRGWILR